LRILRHLAVSMAVGTAVTLFAFVVEATPTRADTAPAGNLIVLTDFVLGGPTSGPQVPSCVQLSRFSQGSKVVVRTRVIDGFTGQELTDGDLSSVQVTLDSGMVLNERYGNHPGGGAPVTDHFWSAAWSIPADYPTGTVSVSITATASDGRTASWIPFNVAPSSLTVIPATTPAS
jgi:hypothetical protein